MIVGARDKIVREVVGGFLVPTVAMVWAAPHRSGRAAREIAERIATQPRAYLAACRDHEVPGVVDLRYGDDGGPAMALSHQA